MQNEFPTFVPSTTTSQEVFSNSSSHSHWWRSGPSWPRNFRCGQKDFIVRSGTLFPFLFQYFLQTTFHCTTPTDLHHTNTAKMSEPTMACATTGYSLVKAAPMQYQVPSGIAPNSGKAVATDYAGEREFCANLTDPGKDFAFGMTIPISIPKEVTTKRDWRRANR